jgi:uncharacterized protein (TIGR02145 family)
MLGKKCTTCDKKVGGLFEGRNYGTRERALCQSCAEQEQREQSLLALNRRSPLTDPDGNVYPTIKIGNQVWTVENLRSTRYNDGTPIALVAAGSDWERTSPAYCWYDNEPSNKEKYGALYNWFAIGTGKLAPRGWHVPTDVEWSQLAEYLVANGYNWDRTSTGTVEDNKIGKSLAAKTDWYSDSVPGSIGNDLSKNDRSGFSGLPGGCRDREGDFNNEGLNGRWWSATERDATDAWDRSLRFGSLFRNHLSKRNGFSVRLVQD